MLCTQKRSTRNGPESDLDLHLTRLLGTALMFLFSSIGFAFSFWLSFVSLPYVENYIQRELGNEAVTPCLPVDAGIYVCQFFLPANSIHSIAMDTCSSEALLNPIFDLLSAYLLPFVISLDICHLRDL